MYVTETEIAEKLREALGAYGDIKAGTPLYDLTAVIGEVFSKHINQLTDDKIDKGDLSGVQIDLEMVKQIRPDSQEVADILWEKLRKEDESKKGDFISELEKL